MTRESIREYAAAQRERYRRGRRTDKGRILDEVVAVTGYHRKAAIRLLRRWPRPPAARRRVGRPRVYDAAVAAAARVVWDAAGQIGAKRLQPFVPKLVDRLVAHRELSPEPATDGLLRAASAATLERLLAPARATAPPRGRATTRAGSLLKGQIPIKTFTDWDDARPGFLEIDLVAHCGDSTAGFSLCTLTAVDVATGWVELEAVWGKGQQRVGGAVHRVRQRLPVTLLGLDSDNGSEFINHGLLDYCRRHAITFTRSRPYKKNDSAHVEQKNGAIVRHLVGYDRYHSTAAYAQLARVYRLVRLHTNFFQPVQKLLRKTRDGAKVHREYDRARTPYQRLRAAGALDAATRGQLEALCGTLNPLRLRRQIDVELARLWTLAVPPAAAATRKDDPDPVTVTSEARIPSGNTHL